PMSNDCLATLMIVNSPPLLLLYRSFYGKSATVASKNDFIPNGFDTFLSYLSLIGRRFLMLTVLSRVF
ncbi:MAG: hypothetical protein ACI4TN_01435, partial [Candidatus Enterosoma sp.]